MYFFRFHFGRTSLLLLSLSEYAIKIAFMKYRLFTLFLSSFSIAYSQTTFEINGAVFNESNVPLDLCAINLFQQSDSSFVKTEFTDQDGSFLLSGIEKGAYYILVKQFDYVDYKLDIQVEQSFTIPNIQLEKSAQDLEQVVVTHKVPFIERQIDRVVVTPDALIANAGSNALEVLERAPGVTVDQNGTILLKGRSGVAVFINDKPSYLSGTELENYLKTLPAGSIKNIEIMENPPAKYDAEGNAGVININIKRSTMKGLFGNTSVSYRRSRYNSSNNSLNLNYNRNKISLYANVYAGFWGSYQDLNINRYYLNQDNSLASSFEQNSFNENDGKYLDGKVGMDYYLSDKSTIGIAYKLSTSPSNRGVDNTALIRNASGDLVQRVVADNLSQRTFENNLINAYFSHSLDSLGSKISVDADYVNYKSTNDQTFKNYQYNQNEQLIYADLINGEIPSEISIYAMKSDYTKTLKGKSKLDAGLKTVLTKTDNEAIYSTTVGGVTTPDYNLSNRFLYDEWINSAYVNYSTELGRFGLQLGLRGEYTQLEGNQLGNAVTADTSFTREYASLFPTFYASTQLDSAGNHGMYFSYGRRINRPYFQDLNPFISPLDKFTFYTGNPNLLPTYSHNLSLSYSFKNMINTALSYSLVTDGIQETLEIQDSLYFSRPGNIASSQFLSLSVDGHFSVASWYDLNLYTEVALVSFKSDLYTEQLNSQGINVFASITNSFKLGKGWKIDVSGRALNDQVASQLLIKGYGTIDVGVQKNILKGRASVKVSATDIFHTQRGDGIINNLRLTNADWNSKYDSRSVRLTFSWRFGKSTMNKKKHNSSGSDAEQDRVKG